MNNEKHPECRHHVCIDEITFAIEVALKALEEAWKKYDLSCDDVKNIKSTRGSDLMSIAEDLTEILEDINKKLIHEKEANVCIKVQWTMPKK